MKIHIKPTMNCNLDCYYCNEKHRKNKMSLETAVDIVRKITQASQIKEQKSIEFEWSGGEPLLMGASFFRNIFSLQRNILSIKAYNTLYSNILLLNEEMADLLAEARADVYTSLDDLSDNSLRRGILDHYFEVFDSRLNLLIERNLRVKLYMTVTNQNVNAISAVYQYAKNHSVDFDFANLQKPFIEPDQRIRALSPSIYDFQDNAIKVFEDWYCNPSEQTTVKPYYAVLQYLVTVERLKPKTLISFDPHGRLFSCPFDISKNQIYCETNSWDVDTLIQLIDKPCRQSSSPKSLCEGCSFVDFCNLMLCKDYIKNDGYSSLSKFETTCHYWKPIFTHIHNRILSDLKPRT